MIQNILKDEIQDRTRGDTYLGDLWSNVKGFGKKYTENCLKANIVKHRYFTFRQI